MVIFQDLPIKNGDLPIFAIVFCRFTISGISKAWHETRWLSGSGPLGSDKAWDCRWIVPEIEKELPKQDFKTYRSKPSMFAILFNKKNNIS